MPLSQMQASEYYDKNKYNRYRYLHRFIELVWMEIVEIDRSFQKFLGAQKPGVAE
jgi:hypothetical protein